MAVQARVTSRSTVATSTFERPSSTCTDKPRFAASIYAVSSRAHMSDDAAELSWVLGLTGSSGVAEAMQGGYVQLGYNVLSQLTTTGVGLTPYVRYERVDTQAAMPAGFERSLSTDNTFSTLGVEVKPIPNVVMKVDYSWVGNEANSAVNQFNVNLGYAF